MELQKSTLLKEHKMQWCTLFLYQGAEGKIHLQCFDRNKELAFECYCVEGAACDEKYCFFLNGLEKSWYFFKDDYFRPHLKKVGQPLFEGYFLVLDKQGGAGPEMILFKFGGYYGLASYRTYDVMYDNDFILIGEEGYHRLFYRKGSRAVASAEIVLSKEDSFDVFPFEDGIIHVPFKTDITLKWVRCLEKDIYEIKW